MSNIEQDTASQQLEEPATGSEVPSPQKTEEPATGSEVPSPQKTEEPALNSSDDWGEDITPDEDKKKLFKKILTPGSDSETPSIGNEVSVHYTGRLLNGDVFDSSVERNEKFKFKLGGGQVIKGWDVGVATMTKGEKCLLTCTPTYAYGKDGSEGKIGPNETLQFEIELFDWKGEDISSDRGVIKHILIRGEGHSKPADGATVEAHIRGMHNGRVFQESDVTFEFGEGIEKGVVSGVELAIGSMKLTESARILVQPQYGYGDKGSAEVGIPGGAELVFEIRLNNFTQAKEPWDYDNLEERLAGATQLKERGGKYFKEGKYELAKKLYNRGAELITDTSLRKEDVKEEAKPFRVALHLNIAACHLKLLEPSEALKECKEVLTDDGENVKAFFRSGQANQMLQELDEAMEAFQKVLGIEPNNKAARNQLVQTRNQIKAQRDQEKKRYANMFEKLASGSEEEGATEMAVEESKEEQSEEAKEPVEANEEPPAVSPENTESMES